MLENFVSTTWAREDCPRVECHILRHFKEDQFRMSPFDYGEKSDEQLMREPAYNMFFALMSFIVCGIL